MRLTLTIESPTLTMAKNMGVHKKTDLKSVFSLVINDLRLSLAEEVSAFLVFRVVQQPPIKFHK